MERRVQCLERIVREQQQEMERLIGIVLTRNVSPIEIAFQTNAQTAGARALTAPTGVIPRFDTEIPNQNFYFHDEVNQPLASAGKEVAVRQRKTPIGKEQSWDAKKKVPGFIEKKDKAPEGVHAFTRALSVQPAVNSRLKPKSAVHLRVPMKQSRAVNAAKDFIDYIAVKEGIIIKAASGAHSSSGPNYSANSRSNPQSGPTAPLSTSRNRKKIAAPTVDSNAKKSSLTPEKNIDRRNQARPASTNSVAGRTTFVSNFDRDSLNNNARTAFVSNSDRRTFISNSDRNVVDTYADREPYDYNAERNVYPPNSHHRAFVDNSDRYLPPNYVDRNAFVGNTAHRAFNYSADRNIYPPNNDHRAFIDNSERYLASNYVDRNAFVGNTAHRAFNYSADRIVYPPNGPHPFMSSTDRNTLAKSTFVGNVDRLSPIIEPDRGLLTSNFDNYVALDSAIPIVINDSPSRSSVPVSVNSDRNADRASHVPSYQQPVINLTMTSIGSKRKEKEKATEESEMNKKKPAAIRQEAATTVASIAPSSLTSRQSSEPTTSSSSSSSVKAKARSPPAIRPPAASHSSSSSVISYKSSESSSSSDSSDSSSSSSSSSSYTTAYPSYSSSRPPPKPSSSAKPSSQTSSSSRSSTQVPSTNFSQTQSKSGTSTRSESNFQDMTGDESDNQSGNEQDKQKIKKVLTLIQSLTSLSDRLQMAEQLLDKYKTKPAKTKKLINAGKEIFQEWLVEEVLNFSEETNVQLVEMMLQVADKATWTPGDISRLRVDRTIRQCYKSCSKLFGESPSSFPPCTNLINLTKEMWPKYRQMYKTFNSNTTALRNTVDNFKDARDYWQ